MKFKPESNLSLADPDGSEDTVENSTSGGTKAVKSAPKPSRKPKSSTANNEEYVTPGPDESLVNDLVAKADLLFKASGATEKKLLDQRIEVGGILVELKGIVGHGNFLTAFKKWQHDGKINFSVKTGERAMAYADLKAAGKFDTLANLAEAERIRKDEAAKKNAEKRAAKTGDEEPGEPPPPKLTQPQIAVKARQLVKPALKECQGYDAGSQRLLLEEMIEILTEQLESCR